MFLLRILTLRRQFEQFDHQLDRLRTLTGRKA